MNRNIGTPERMFRVIIGLAIAAISLFYQSWWGIAGLEVAITGIIGWSPLYRLFDISTTARGRISHAV